MEVTERPSDTSAHSDDDHDLTTSLVQGLIVAGSRLVAQPVPHRIVAEEEEEEGDDEPRRRRERPERERRRRRKRRESDEGDEEEYRLRNVG